MPKDLIIDCPGCKSDKKRILIKEQAKSLIRCSKCSHFVLIIRGETENEPYNYLTQEEELFFNIYAHKSREAYENIIFQGIYYVLVAHTEFNDKNVKILTEKSKKVGVALEKYMKNGDKKILTPHERNLLYKLKAENIIDIEQKIEEKIKYLEAKIECIKLLRVLDY